MDRRTRHNIPIEGDREILPRETERENPAHTGKSHSIDTGNFTHAKLQRSVPLCPCVGGVWRACVRYGKCS